MNVNLVTDAPKHNLALMKMSTLQKANGHDVHLNGVGKFDYTIGSWLFTNSEKTICDHEGGPGIDPSIRNEWCDTLKPDYSLYPYQDFSLGYTWSYCPRNCAFCFVPQQNNPKVHQSIHTFHNPKFKKICLLNNNTFSDPQWLETFEEIWDADLTLIDENGYDLRLIDEEKAKALKKTRFKGGIHFAWDNMDDEAKIIRGLKILSKNKLRTTSNMVYVLIGYNTNIEEDLHRCQIIDDFGLVPYPMPYKKTKELKKFKRFINLYYYRKYSTIKEAWEQYNH